MKIIVKTSARIFETKEYYLNVVQYSVQRNKQPSVGIYHMNFNKFRLKLLQVTKAGSTKVGNF